LRSVINTQNNHKNKKGARFLETQCITTNTRHTTFSLSSDSRVTGDLWELLR